MSWVRRSGAGVDPVRVSSQRDIMLALGKPSVMRSARQLGDVLIRHGVEWYGWVCARRRYQFLRDFAKSGHLFRHEPEQLRMSTQTCHTGTARLRGPGQPSQVPCRANHAALSDRESHYYQGE
jgi:hypothetical protein